MAGPFGGSSSEIGEEEIDAVLELVGDVRGRRDTTRRRCRRWRPGRRCSSAPSLSRRGTRGRSRGPCRRRVMTRSKRVRAKLAQRLGGVAGDVDAALGHHAHCVGVERLGMAAGAAGVDGVPRSARRAGPRRSATGRCCRCTGTRPGRPATSAGAGGVTRWDEPDARGGAARRPRRAGAGTGAVPPGSTRLDRRPSCAAR